MDTESGSYIDREKQALSQVYRRLPIVIDRADGCRIYDKDGKSYLDFLSGIAVNALGHGHPAVTAAVVQQVQKYMHVSNYFYQDRQIALGETLKEVSGFDAVFFSNSGSESMEGALKLSAKWGSEKNKTRIIALSGGFHGRTYGPLSIMDKPLYKDGMGPFLPNKLVIPFNDVESLRKSVDEHTCAVALEFLQGEGGVRSISKQFIDELTELRNQYDFLVIADEVQSGVGRTGKFFAYQHYNFLPDIVLLAKAVGGGLPLGAILISKKLKDVWSKGNHGTTYGGNPVACAAGLATVNEVIAHAQENAKSVGQRFMDRLQEVCNDFPETISEVRGLGLMIGVVLHRDEAQLCVETMLQYGCICNATSGNVVRILPPLTVSMAEVDEFIAALRKSLQEMRAQCI